MTGVENVEGMMKTTAAAAAVGGEDEDSPDEIPAVAGVQRVASPKTSPVMNPVVDVGYGVMFRQGNGNATTGADAVVGISTAAVPDVSGSFGGEYRLHDIGALMANSQCFKWYDRIRPVLVPGTSSNSTTSHPHFPRTVMEFWELQKDGKERSPVKQSSS